MPFALPTFIARFWREGIIGILALASVFFYWQWDVTDAKLDTCRAENRATISEIVAAEATATAVQAGNMLRVYQEQQQINEETVNELEANLATARINADRLRRQLAASRSATGAVSVPNVSYSPSGTDGTSGLDGLSLSVTERLECTESSLRLEAIQNWALEQSQIQVNPEPIEE